MESGLNKFIESFLLKETIEFKGSIDDLKSKLNKSFGRNYQVEWLGSNEFKFLADMSYGTAQVKGNPRMIDGIKGYARISMVPDHNHIKVYLFTKLRPEIFYMIVLGILYISVSLISHQFLPAFICSLIIPSALFLWHRSFRKQETLLFETIKRHLLNSD